MKYLFVYYPKCSTCQKAGKWLDDRGIGYAGRHMVEENPSAEELTEWISRSGKPVKRFFNTSGIQYRALNLRDKLPSMTEKEQIEVLASNGMLVKRPLLVADDFVLTGFREEEWREKLS